MECSTIQGNDSTEANLSDEKEKKVFNNDNDDFTEVSQVSNGP